ncbi:HAMP domain-containing sensor histidine kinase [Halovenus sp. HT40]|uniref:HAMP domain-containing sensor histidine kinase n=1 Tax=Halovenus sp. HT40 TaxID=3126691 RepID=UPI00300F67B3
MPPDQQSDDRTARERTVKTAGRIVKYSREIYHLESVEEVANMTLEAAPHFIDGHPSPTVVEIRRDDDLRVLGSMRSELAIGDDPGSLARTAYETGTVTICAEDGTEVGYDEDVTVVDPAEYAEGEFGGVTIAAPTVYSDEMGDSGAILLLHWGSLDRIEEYHVRPVDYLAEHVATAIVNIRSRERLERARNDLAKRKEMVEVYDRLLRHDLGNDLQVITGFSDAVSSMVDDDDQAGEYAEKIHRTARSAAELIDNVGDTVKMLKEEKGRPEARNLEPILTEVVENVDTKFEELTVEYDPEAFEVEAYVGDLIDSVFTNILSNAAVHNDEPVTVRLYAGEPTPETVVVGMADDGKGVAEEIRDEIFEMGQKGPESEGTGFGLGLARTLVESYGGEITVQDSEYGGADFRITLERA